MRDIGRSVTRALGAAALLAATPAMSQIWIGQIAGEMVSQEVAAQQEACMNGEAMPAREIEETRPTAYAAMTGYWAAVQGGGTANVTAYFAPDARAKWSSPTTTLKAAGLASVKDPFGGNGATLDAQPIGYVRSGDTRWVRGQWGVRRAGKRIGTYDALFRRAGGTWKLHQLTLIPVTTYFEPVVQFCHKPNDVLPYRLVSSANLRSSTAKQAAKARTKADMAKADAAKAGGTPLAAEKRARADALEAKAVTAANTFRLAVEANERAKADAAAAKAAKSRAIATLGGG